jgi:hypothetical protein
VALPEPSQPKFNDMLSPHQKNFYHIPWALRGIIEDPKIQRLFGEELKVLKEQYREWKPVTKQLKDLKVMLEPMGGSGLGMPSGGEGMAKWSKL